MFQLMGPLSTDSLSLFSRGTLLTVIHPKAPDVSSHSLQRSLDKMFNC